MIKASRRVVRRTWLTFIFFFRALPYVPVFVLLLLGFQMLFAANILGAYMALTGETVVAEVIMSPLAVDDTGPYIDIEYTPYLHPSALDVALGSEDTGRTRGETQTFRVYGDTVAIRGPMITLHPLWRILGYDNIYELALIEGEYRQAGAMSEGSTFALNGGVDESWWDINSQEAQFPHNTLVRRITLSGDEEFGFSGPNRKRYEIVVTNDTITWNYVEDL